MNQFIAPAAISVLFWTGGPSLLAAAPLPANDEFAITSLEVGVSAGTPFSEAHDAFVVIGRWAVGVAHDSTRTLEVGGLDPPPVAGEPLRVNVSEFPTRVSHGGDRDGVKVSWRVSVNNPGPHTQRFDLGQAEITGAAQARLPLYRGNEIWLRPGERIVDAPVAIRVQPHAPVGRYRVDTVLYLEGKPVGTDGFTVDLVP